MGDVKYTCVPQRYGALRCTVIVTLLLLVSACAGTHPSSNQRRAERVVIEPEIRKMGLVPMGVVAAALAPKIVEFGVGKLAASFESRAEQYTAEYSAVYVGDNFYSSTDGLELSYSAYEISRFVAAPSGNEEVLASRIKLGFIANREGSLLRVVPLEVRVDKAKARLQKSDSDLDLIIDFSLSGYWTNKSQDVKSKELGTVTTVLRQLQLGETYRLVRDAEADQEFLEDRKGKRTNFNPGSSWISPVPVSLNAAGKRAEKAQGNYALTIRVTEVDDYGQRVRSLGNDIKASKAIWTELAKQLAQ